MPSKNKRAFRLISNYSITEQEYADMLHQQNGVCKICRKTCTKYKVLCVDHDHRSGVVRGLLCNRCNRALGMFYDDPELLKKAASYITNNTPIYNR